MMQRTITIVLILIVIGGLAWYINKNYLAQDNSVSSFGNIGKSVVPQVGTDALVYATTGNVREIWLWQEKSRKVFTDSDEAEKILKLSNLAPRSREVMAIVNKNPAATSGKLVVINVENGQNTTLLDEFSVPIYWSISPDGAKIALVKFSNIEEEYGYTLYLAGREGKIEKKLFNSSSEIKSPSWNQAASKIAFTSFKDLESQLQVLDLASGKVSTIKSFSEITIDSLNFQDQKIIFSKMEFGAKIGEIDLIDPDGTNMSKILDFQGGSVSFLYWSPDSLKFAYLIAQYGERLDDKTSGQIYLANIQGSEKKALAKGSQVLGWWPKEQ